MHNGHEKHLLKDKRLLNPCQGVKDKLNQQGEGQGPASAFPFPNTTYSNSGENRQVSGSGQKRGEFKKESRKNEKTSHQNLQSIIKKEKASSLIPMNFVKSSRICPVEQDKTSKCPRSSPKLHLRSHPLTFPPWGPSPSEAPPCSLQHTLSCLTDQLPILKCPLKFGWTLEYRQSSRLRTERQTEPKRLTARLRNLGFVKQARVSEKVCQEWHSSSCVLVMAVNALNCLDSSLHLLSSYCVALDN